MNKRSGYRCSFRDCLNISTERRQKETLFRFSKDTKRSKLWVAACGRNDLLSKTPIELYNNYRICKLHFTSSMFLNYEQTRLQSHAIPSSILRRNNVEECTKTKNTYLMKIKPTEVTITEVNAIDLLEKNILQEETNKERELLDTETPLSISSCSIGVQTKMISSSK